ncbi:MAG: hypothetical protein E7428_08630 [Ruminococcaceae bacterium]|nr:hypothetical protein [Oscillospiraceae bacterium]
MKKTILFALCALVLAAMLVSCGGKEPYMIQTLTYPENIVKTLEERGLTPESFAAFAAGNTSYQGNAGREETNLVVSPYFTAVLDEEILPVYATPVYIGSEYRGTLHSFASADVSFGNHKKITLTLTVDPGVSVERAEVFANDPAKLTQSGQTITLEIGSYGTYTLVLNDSQDAAFTLFVREYADENSEIAAYQEKYGEDKVLIYEPGLHEVDPILLSGDSVLYLKAGALLLPKHTIDIQTDEAAAGSAEEGAVEANAIGLNRFPVVNACNAENITIAGRGTIDMTRLDWHERRGVVFTLCKNITVDGLILVNPCEWAYINYRCEGVSVTQSAVFGYRTNSDAFAICNSVNVNVTDSFARTGDDMFEVKTLGGEETAVSRDITFSRCVAWGSKARCFGVIGEIERDVSNILFEDGIVLFRDATWDNDRIGSLVVLRETGHGAVDNVTFRNITIHKDFGRPILCGNYSMDLTESKLEGIQFENITYTADMQAQVWRNAGEGNLLDVTFQKVTGNGEALTEGNLSKLVFYDSADSITVTE